MEDFVLQAEPTVFGPFKIGPDDYVLVGADEGAHSAYKNATMRGMQVIADEKDNKTVTSRGTAEADAILISKCLFKLVNGQRQAVDVKFVNSLPRQSSKRLYEKVREISGMDEDESSGKGGRSSTPDTSP